MKSWVDIAIAGRSTERHRLQASGTTTIGREAPADIALRGVDALMSEHFCLRPQPEGCWVELVESAPEPFTFDGRPSRGCLVPWEQEIFYGAVRLTFHGEAARHAAKRVSPVVWLAAVVVPLASFLLVNEREVGALDLEGSVKKPPALFGEAPACAEAAQGALGRGNIAEQTAYAKHERGAFEVVDAVEAVELLREAAQCYLLAGQEGDAARANRVAAGWIDKLGLTYQRALLDFELARRKGSPPAIVASSTKLQTFLTYAGPQAAEYKGWLEQVVRAQRAARAAKAAAKKEKKK